MIHNNCILFFDKDTTELTLQGEVNVIMNKSVIHISRLDYGLVCSYSYGTNIEAKTIGQWKFPDGRSVMNTSTSGSIYYDQTNQRDTRLYRRNDALSPTGLYCCEITDRCNTMQTLCVTIGMTDIITVNLHTDDNNLYTISLAIKCLVVMSQSHQMVTGNSEAGEMFTLTCSIDLMIDDTSITWLNYLNKSANNAVDSDLTFDPLQASQAGTYTCQIYIDNNVMVMKTVTVEVNGEYQLHACI